MRRFLLGSVVACVLVVGASPALGHPFGPPPTALVTARGNSVFIEWVSAPDDAMSIGVQVGLLPEGIEEQYLEAPTQVAPSREMEEQLNRSQELRDYLLTHIQVHQDGRACTATVQPISDFVRDGARVVHECPAAVTAVDIEITMLHDIHEAYRTFAVTSEYARPSQAVYSVTSPRHTWDFTANPETATSRGFPAWLPLLVIGGLIVLVGIIVAVGRSSDA